jgi:flagellar M-ring protein FliF
VFQQVRKIWQKMAAPQRALLVGVAGLLVAGVVAAAIWGSKPAFRLLKGGLDRETAAKALARLDESGVTYRLENDGRDILVDVRDFEEAQATLVQNQIVAAEDGSGYRGLDAVSFGLTEEQQKLRMRVALEEEIARSLRQFDGVESAKVHLTSAEKSFNRRDSAPAKASVVLRLRQGRSLDEGQTQAMARLVANASPGLLTENVILTDTRGTLLSHGAGGGEDASSVLNQTRMRENYLADKAQSALDRALGPDQAIVRVDVVLESEKTDSTKTIIRPETQVKVQEKLSNTEESPKKVGGAPGGDPTKLAADVGTRGGGTSSEDSTVTYDYERETLHTTREKAGIVRRLTVGVLVDEKLLEKKEQIKSLVTAAVGWDAERDPPFEPAFVPFAARPAVDEPAASPEAGGWRAPPVIELVKWGVTGLVALVLGVVVLRSIRAARASVRVAFSESSRDSKPDARRVDPAEKLSQEIERDAQGVGRLLRNWLYETSTRN